MSGDDASQRSTFVSLWLCVKNSGSGFARRNSVDDPGPALGRHPREGGLHFGEAFEGLVLRAEFVRKR
jgi:hypothetical protein